MKHGTKRTALLLSLALAFILIFTSCGNGGNTTKAETTAAQATEAATTKAAETTEAASAEETTVAEETTAPEEPIVIRVGAPKAPPILPVLRMMQDKAMGENVEIVLDFWETPEQLIAMVQSDQNDMYAFPLTVVAKLYNKGLDVQLTNVNTWGVAYFLSKDPDVKTWADLKDKQVYIPLQSSPPDVLAQFFLKDAGLTKDDYEIIYTSKTELAEMMIGGKVDNGVLIEPLVSIVTTKNPEMKVVMAYEEEFQRVRGTDQMIPNAGMGASGRFAREHKDLVVRFEQEYAKALDWLKENPQEAGALAEEKIGMKKPIIAKAIPNMGIYYKSAIDAKPELDEFYQLLFDFNPKCVGGKIPDENMYFKED